MNLKIEIWGGLRGSYLKLPRGDAYEPRPPGIPIREFPGFPGNSPLQKFLAGIPGNF